MQTTNPSTGYRDQRSTKPASSVGEMRRRRTHRDTWDIFHVCLVAATDLSASGCSATSGWVCWLSHDPVGAAARVCVKRRNPVRFQNVRSERCMLSRCLAERNRFFVGGGRLLRHDRSNKSLLGSPASKSILEGSSQQQMLATERSLIQI